MPHAPTAPLAASLQRIDAAEALRARALFCEPLAQALAAWVPGLALAPAPAWPPAADDEAGARFGVLLRGRGAELQLLLPQSIDAVSAAILAAGAWSPSVQLSCLRVRAAATVGALLQWLGRIGLQPVGLQTQPEPLPAAPGATTFACQVGGHHIEGWLHSSDPGWLAQATAAVARLAPGGWGPARALLLPLRARLGTRRLALALLRTLEVGDVLLLDGQFQRPSQAGGCLVVAGALRSRAAVARACSVRGHAITILGDTWMKTDTLSPPATGEHDAPAAANTRRAVPDPVADIEVDVHFELQVLSTPLAELAAMRPGYVIELPVPAAEACVSLVVGGQVYGRAQLVSIGDRLGARILELFHDT